MNLYDFIIEKIMPIESLKDVTNQVTSDPGAEGLLILRSPV